MQSSSSSSNNQTEYSLIVTTTENNQPASSSLKNQSKEELLEMEKKSIVLVKMILSLQEKIISTLFTPNEIIGIPNWLVYLQWKDDQNWRENVPAVLNTCFDGMIGKWDGLTQEQKEEQIKNIEKSITFATQLQELQEQMQELEKKLKKMH